MMRWTLPHMDVIGAEVERKGEEEPLPAPRIASTQAILVGKSEPLSEEHGAHVLPTTVQRRTKPEQEQNHRYLRDARPGERGRLDMGTRRAGGSSGAICDRVPGPDIRLSPR